MVFYNGKWYFDPLRVRVPFAFSSYSYGYGVYETLRTLHGKIFFLEEHIDRLFASASLIGLKPTYSQKDISDITQKTFEKSKKDEARIKIILTETELIVLVQELVLRPPDWYETGISVGVIEMERPIPEAKTLNGLHFSMTQKVCKEKNLYECVLVDREGGVREGSISNVFWIKNAVLFTPKSRILQGVTRRMVMNIAKESMEVCERDAKIEEVLQADECFLTNTTSNVLPIVKVENTLIGNGKVGEKTKWLMEEVQKFF